MRLCVKTVGGVVRDVDVDPDLPMAVARVQVASALGIDEGEVALIQRGAVLSVEKDGETLRSSGLTDGAVLVAVPRGGTPKATSSASANSGKVHSENGSVHIESATTTAGDSDLARQMQLDDDESVARKLQEDLDHNLARDTQAKQGPGGEVPRLLFINGDFVASRATIPLMVDTGAQTSVLTTQVVERLGLTASIDRRYAGVAGGVGTARILGRLSAVEVGFGELSLSVDFQVLDGSQMPSPNLAILGLDQLAVHHMVVDLDRNVVLVGGIEGYLIRCLDAHEVPPEFSGQPRQQCTIQ